MNKHITIAIDGPVGSGKGTLSVALSNRLGILYLYTGGMYRALALACIRAEVDLTQEDEVLTVLRKCDLHLKVMSGQTAIYLGSEDITEAIIRPEVSNMTPIIAAHRKVREEMVSRQKALVSGQSAVIEGRDIATVVAPNADIKIYLNASLEERAKRRFEQFKERGIEKTYDEVLLDTEERDRKDMVRDNSPLHHASDAVDVDTTSDSIDQTVDKVLDLLKERNLL